MKLTNFITSLLPGLSKDLVISDMDELQDELKKQTLPAIHLASTYFKVNKFKSVKMLKYQSVFADMVRGTSGNLFVKLDSMLPDVVVNLAFIEKLIEQTYNEEIITAGLTFQRAQVLQLVSLATFFVEYARKLSDFAFLCETAEFEEGGTTIADSMVPAQIEWIEANFVTFCQTVNIFGTPATKFRKQVTDIPDDIVVTPENVSVIEANHGSTKLDPMGARFIPVMFWPIYHFRMFVTEWKDNRRIKAKEELQRVQLRKLNLERVANGNPDAALQKEIRYLDKRIQDLSRRIEKIEKDGEPQ